MKFLNHKRNVELCSNNTITAQASDLSLFIDFIEKEHIELEEVYIQELVQFREYLIKEPSLKTGQHRTAKTINRCMKTVVSFYRYLYTYGNLDVNISKDIKKESNQNKSIGMLDGIARQSKVATSLLTIKEIDFQEDILTPTELHLIIQCCRSKRDRVLIRLLIETGIRIGELINIRIEDIDLYNTSIHIVDRRYEDEGYRLKSVNSQREIPITKSLINELMEYITDEYFNIDSNYIFNKINGANRGTKLDYGSVHALIKRIRSKTNINRLHAHLIRRTTITNWILNGMSKPVVMKLAGHKSITTTEKYYLHISHLRIAQELNEYERNKLLNE